MTKLTRKSLFKKTSTGALMVGALGALPGVAAVAAGRSAMASTDTWQAEMGSAEPFLVYVRNPRAGELVLMVGGQEITYHDPALVARLWQSRHNVSHRPAQSSVVR